MELGGQKKSKRKGIFGKIYRMLGKNKKSDKKKIKTKDNKSEPTRSKSESAEFLEK